MRGRLAWVHFGGPPKSDTRPIIRYDYNMILTSMKYISCRLYRLKENHLLKRGQLQFTRWHTTSKTTRPEFQLQSAQLTLSLADCWAQTTSKSVQSFPPRKPILWVHLRLRENTRENTWIEREVLETSATQFLKSKQHIISKSAHCCYHVKLNVEI